MRPNFFLALILGAFLLCLMGRAIFSWVEPYPRSHLHRILWDITEPIINPVRRIIPPVGGLDLAYLVVFLIVSFLMQLVSSL